MQSVRWFALATAATLRVSLLGSTSVAATGAAGVDTVTIAQTTVDGTYPTGAPITEASGVCLTLKTVIQRACRPT